MPLLKLNKAGKMKSFGFEQNEMGNIIDDIIETGSSVYSSAKEMVYDPIANAAKAAAAGKINLSDVLGAAQYAALKLNPIIKPVVKLSPVPQIIKVVKNPTPSNILGAVTTIGVNTLVDPLGLIRLTTDYDPGSIAASQVTMPEGGVAKVDDRGVSAEPIYVEEIEYVDENGNVLTKEQAEALMAQINQPAPKYVDQYGNALTDEQVAAYFAAKQIAAKLQQEQTWSENAKAAEAQTQTTPSVTTAPIETPAPIVAAPAQGVNTKHPMAIYNLA